MTITHLQSFLTYISKKRLKEERIKIEKNGKKGREELSKKKKKKDKALEAMAAQLNANKVIMKEIGEIWQKMRETKKMKQQNKVEVKSSTIIKQYKDMEERIKETIEVLIACKDKAVEIYTQM